MFPCITMIFNSLILQNLFLLLFFHMPLQVCFCSYYLQNSESVFTKAYCDCDPYTCPISCYFCSCILNLLTWTGYLRMDRIKTPEKFLPFNDKTCNLSYSRLKPLRVNHNIIQFHNICLNHYRLLCIYLARYAIQILKGNKDESTKFVNFNII